MNILVLNGGSSSFKCWFSDSVQSPRPLWSARADWSHHTGSAEIRIERSGSDVINQTLKGESPVAVLEPVLQALWTGAAKVVDGPANIDVVGHRIVHGGLKYRTPVPLTAEVRDAIAREVEFAPSHNRFELEAIRTVDRVVGTGVQQIAVFDTGFHSTLEPVAYVYPGPYDWLQQGVRRYGFHGISHQYASERAAQMLAKKSLRLITCHLGNGASLAAIRAGKSIDTTMGFTPLDGLMMGTRTGSLDPGILVYLLRHRGYTASQLDEVLNKESGLLGVSGLSGDMREIVSAMEQGHERARLAFDVYVHRLVRELGSMLAVLGGVDALVFTGGVGENSPGVRKQACAQFAFLGLRLDEEKNARPKLDQDVAAADSTTRALVIRAEEEWAIARECARLSS